MKNRSNISYFSYAFMALVFMGAVTACVNEEDFGTDSVKPSNKEGLAVSPTISESEVRVATTRAASVDTLQEKTLNTLDVFVEHVSTADAGKIMKQYHLINAAEGELNLLASRWRQEGLQEGEKYNIYVASNNPLTKQTFGLDTFTVSKLKALTFNEVKAGIAELDGDGNIKNDGNSTTGNIYKRYSSGITGRAYTKSKEFMMDGVIKDWTPDPASLTQTFDVTMNRAAAKIVLNVTFNEEFVKSLAYDKDADGEYTIPKSDEEKVTITGTPAWKFYNFAFGAPVFDPSPGNPTTEGLEVHNSGFNIFHNESAADGAPFTITTYSYPNKWEDTTSAPSLVVSVGYTQNGVQSFHYYRIPIVSKETKTLNRNTIYVIDAEIATRGSETHEDITEMKDLTYEVLPWNDESNSVAIHDVVESVQQYYFKVNPTVYTLRGDGEQSVVLNYLKAAGTKVNWKLFTYDSNGNQTGVVAKDNANAVRAWFYDASGNFITTYGDSNQNPWTNMGVTITQSTENTTGSSGTITVSSQALTNKGIKYIRLRVYLDEVVDGESLEETYHEDVIIRHFPTDNIQNITGSWSSYHTTSGGGTSMVTLKTFSLSEAQSWAEQYGVAFTSSEVDIVDNITYSEYTAHTGEEGYAIASNQQNTQGSTFRTNVPNATQRASANSQANAVLGIDGYSYWGTNPDYQGRDYDDEPYYESSYDYYTVEPNYGSYSYYYYYNYQNHYRARYTHTYKRTQYSVTVEMASTGNWVDWDRDANKTYSGNDRKINGNDNFFAKAYSDGIINAIVVNNSGSSKTYTLKHGDGGDDYYYWDGSQTESVRTYFNATNNHMYVIQISSTSDKYVLGRPVLGNPDANRSRDDVVSPAFMIASQLGAVLPFTGNNASQNSANHCAQYMEVGTDGTRYTGWRLPTRSEINVINGYQQGVINGVTVPLQYQTMVEVLGGERYWCLAGQRIRTSDGAVVTSGDTYLRCVRDLSADEVDRLNGFDKIIEKYQ
ncbi:MAG: hypothetical protein IJV42_08875 [Bacteroidaceae bacterium]|nr:hypothetical protein [Bacteroidaceae bacterium]